MPPFVLYLFSLTLCLLSWSCENPADRSTAADLAEAAQVDKVVVTGEKWAFMESSSIRFVSSNFTNSHKGGFKAFAGFFHIEGDSLAASGHAFTIEMNSLYTDNELLTKHLKDADFFKVEQFPQCSFIVTAIRECKDREEFTHELTGNFSLSGVTKSLTIPVSVTRSEEMVRVQADFYIDRIEFGVGFGMGKDEFVRREVTILLDLVAKPVAKSADLAS